MGLSGVAFVVVIGLAAVAFYAIISAALVPSSAWRTADRNQVVWIILLLVFWPASLIYVFKVRDELRAAAMSTISMSGGSTPSTRVSSPRKPPVIDLAALERAAVLLCSECGFTSNAREATACRNCGSANLVGR